MFESKSNARGHRRLGRLLSGLLILAVCVVGGCDKAKKKAAAMVTSAKGAVASVAEKPKQKLIAATSDNKIKLQLSPPLEISPANIAVITIGDGRKNVVQIANYDLSGAPKTYPSILIQGNTKIADAASLAGQSISCELYMRENGTSPIAMTPSGKTVQVTFKTFDAKNKTVSATIAQTELISSDNTKLTLGGGTIVALVGGGS